MTPDSIAYFGLRTNAHQLVGGAGAVAARRRIKTAALLQDFVYLEGGVYQVTAGPGGSIPFFSNSVPDGYPIAWPHPNERHGGELNVAVRADDTPDAPFHRILHGPATINWRASFAPLLDELPKSLDWLQVVVVNDGDGLETAAKALAREDEDDPYLLTRWPDRFVRSVVAQGAARDLLRAAAGQSVLCVDNFHSRLIQARIHRGQATPALGHHAISIIEPRELTWAEVDELHRHRGMREYRTVLREIESEARDEATSLDDLNRTILRKYGDALARAASSQPSRRSRLGVATLGLVVGEGIGLAAGVPVVGGLMGGAVGESASRAVTRFTQPRWLAVHGALRGQR